MPVLSGNELAPHVQADALRRFVHRFTESRRPDWAKANPNYKPQFRDDADWLANSRFHVTKRGELDGRRRYCESSPTWPQGKGVWGEKGKDW